ncbi:MAG: DUF3857 domain-containing protein [Acidobacteriota bacterium]
MTQERSRATFPAHWVQGTLLLVAMVLLPVSVFAGNPYKWIAPSPAEMELTELDWYPDAPAVFLKRATILIFGFEGSKGFPTRWHEYRRLKILNSEGLRLATVSLPSASWAKIEDLDARIIQPDGQIRKLKRADIFKKERSAKDRYHVVSFALPQAEVGSIIEYRYSVILPNVLHAWQLYFQNWLPVMESTVAVEVNQYAVYDIKIYNPLPIEPELEITEKASQGVVTKRATYTLRDLPLVPDEPFSPPFSEIAARLELMPRRAKVAYGGMVPITGDRSWEYVARLMSFSYEPFGEWAPKTEQLAEGAARKFEDPRDRARVIYDYVHRGIELGDSPCKGGKACPPDKLIKAKKADAWDKLMLLRYMLTTSGIPASVALMSTRLDPVMDERFPDSSKIRHMLVTAEVGKEHIFLDPLNEYYGFARLEPHLEGVSTILVDEKSPEWLTTPRRSADESVRRARVELHVNGEGIVSGTGNLRLTGHHAWLQEMWDKNNPALSIWKEWLTLAGIQPVSLETAYPDLDVGPEEIDTGKRQGTFSSTWSLASSQPTDLVTLSSAAPLSMEHNIFVLEADRRSTEARLPFAFVDEIEVHVDWAEGWQLDGWPEEGKLANDVGELRTEVEMEGRSLRYRRILRLNETDVRTGRPYSHLRDLFEACVHADLQPILVARED